MRRRLTLLQIHDCLAGDRWRCRAAGRCVMLIGDTESDGSLKRPYHPLSTEVDGVVRFSPYMIVEIAKERQR